MKKKIIFIFIAFVGIVFIATGLIYYFSSQSSINMLNSEYIVALNEIEVLSNNGDYTNMNIKINELQEILRNKEELVKNSYIILIGIICVLCLFMAFLYVYIKILRPFEKMQDYASSLAKGDFNVRLDYERSNYFGEFTWAFDNMRKEIMISRASEKAAIENNKTVIATLSHDIKTPIASIRAYSEALEANLDNTIEKRKKYIDVIVNKCDEVSKLTNDLFLHSLSDLNMLKINLEEVDVCEIVTNTVNELSINTSINYEDPDFKAMCLVDKNRFVQIIENLVTNANKYAKTDVDIKLFNNSDYVELYIKDYGEGINDEDMPFIFDKFYRGKNSTNEQGSGLGLYIVKYIVDSFKGDIILKNNNGLEVIIKIPLKNKFLRTS